jgi:serine/threonine protein kinase/formylglycine-generating enzyme required for sulfatase activity
MAGSESLTDVLCSSCGEVISLVTDETQTLGRETNQMIGHFRLLELVGQGGFGAVWRAEDTQLDRIVAVKMPKRGRMEASESKEFIREAQAAAQLKHPDIVSVHEVGRVGDLLYIVSDFVDGMTLSDWISIHRLSSRESAEMCVTIADAIEHAHQAGVIHRDLKPSNILLDLEGSPNVADFGLAKRQSGDATMTLDGKVIGTPAYMSPEQALGEHVDGRTDVYSIGVLLYEMLTGERPFRGERRMLLHQVISDDPPSPMRLNGNIPRDLETICLKSMEKNPASRYSSAGELADDLRRCLAGEPIHARPVSHYERFKKWAARRPLVASLLAAVTLSLVLGLTGTTWQWRRAVNGQKRHAMTQLELIRDAEPTNVESAIDGLKDFRQWADPELHQLAADEKLPATDRFRIHLALIEQDPKYVDSVLRELLRVSATDGLDYDELALGAAMLAKIDAIPKSRLVTLATDLNQNDELRFRALLMLAQHPQLAQVSDEFPWDDVAPFVIRSLVSRATKSPVYYRTLVDAFRPIHAILLPHFKGVVTGDFDNRNESFTSCSITAEYASDQPEFLCDLALEVRPEQYTSILPYLQLHREFVNQKLASVLADRPVRNANQSATDKSLRRLAVAAVTLLHLNDEPSGVWPLLRQSPEMSLRTQLIHRCAELGLPPEKLIDRMGVESDVSVRRAILLAIGEYGRLPDEIRNRLRPTLEDLYRTDPDAGIHSAIAWLLRAWGKDDLVRSMDSQAPMIGIHADRQWYVNSQGSTMVVVDHPPVFRMGAPKGEPLRTELDRMHLRKVDRKFAVATTEVTWEQFERFVAANSTSVHTHPKYYGPDPNGPVLNVSWVQAAMYCRWLSDQEDMDDDQMCFPELKEINENMDLPDDLMQRTGYRLPSEGEWECVCRTGTPTRRFFGDSEEFLDKYGWHIGNSNDFAWRVGMLKPNDYGLFDVYGNAWEWCLDRNGKLPLRPPDAPYHDAPKLAGTKPRILRGGGMNSRPDALRSAQRQHMEALHNRNHNVGFRIVRTLEN